MPLTIPTIDDRRYQQLLDAALARIPVHTPEWTNFNRSDPGVTLIEIFAFLTENLLYRANQIPERNRRKFLSLLGVPLQAASSARGLVAFASTVSDENGNPHSMTLNNDLEVRAGNVPYRTEVGLDVLPIEAGVYYKRKLEHQGNALDAQTRQYYADLYRAWLDPNDPQAVDKLQLYETTPLETRGEGPGLDLAQTVDGALWVALLARSTDKAPGGGYKLAEARTAIAGKILSLGIAPVLEAASRTLTPANQQDAAANLMLQFDLPAVPSNGGLPTNRTPQYRRLEASAAVDLLTEPGVVQIPLPTADELQLWNNLDPLEAGVKALPPALDDTDKAARIITWLRITAPGGSQIKLLWVGINATTVTQRAHVANELLGEGNGEPDQNFTLTRTPVVPGSLQLTVTPVGEASQRWQPIDDLLAAGPEVPTPDLRLPPGQTSAAALALPAEVYTLDAEAGLIRFGDGLRGKRPPFAAILRADYAYGLGGAGNVGAGAINNGPALPTGIKVTNPIRTWGGAEGETVAAGEKQITRYLQHRERLVTVEDFTTIAQRTPGVEIGRVEVLPAYHPTFSVEPGDAAGAVTLLLIPRYDPVHPNAPQPDQLFLNAVCAHLEPRRLVTTELYLRGPNYLSIWVSIGIKVKPGAGIAQTTAAVRTAINEFLSPFTWPLNKPVNNRELMAVASRVPDVLLVNDVLVAEGSGPVSPLILLHGLQLPQIMGIAIGLGDPTPMDDVRGTQTTAEQGEHTFVAVPIIPEACQ